MRFITVTQIDHGLPPVAAFAVNVLEQVERYRPASVEQADIAFLGIEQVGAGESVQQRLQGGALFAAKQSIIRQRTGQFRHGLLHRLIGIAQQRGQDAKGQAHQNTSVGVWSFLRAGAPNRFGSLVPPEQPLPNEKPQPLFSAYMSSTSSRWPVGMTKRSS